MNEQENKLIIAMNEVVQQHMGEAANRRTFERMAHAFNEKGVACQLGDFCLHMFEQEQYKVEEVIVFKGIDRRLVFGRGTLTLVAASDIGKVYQP